MDFRTWLKKKKKIKTQTKNIPRKKKKLPSCLLTLTQIDTVCNASASSLKAVIELMGGTQVTIRGVGHLQVLCVIMGGTRVLLGGAQGNFCRTGESSAGDLQEHHRMMLTEWRQIQRQDDGFQAEALMEFI